MALPDTNYDLEAGTTWSEPVGWFDATDQPINLTGYSAVMELRSGATHAGTQLYYTLSTSGLTPQITIPTPTNGYFQLKIPSTDTALFKFKQAYYDLIVTSPSGDVTKLIKGIITVHPSVSV